VIGKSSSVKNNLITLNDIHKIYVLTCKNHVYGNNEKYRVYKGDIDYSGYLLILCCLLDNGFWIIDGDFCQKYYKSATVTIGESEKHRISSIKYKFDPKNLNNIISNYVETGILKTN
jgi:hypothetical protein